MERKHTINNIKLFLLLFIYTCRIDYKIDSIYLGIYIYKYLIKVI